jgi:hypothetical protein
MPVLAVWISLLATLLGPADDPECYALGGLDVARAQALADADVTALQRVYADMASAKRDRSLLQRYGARGYRIVGAVMIRGSCRVVHRSDERVELDVVERLASAWVVSELGKVTRLPRDGFDRHRVVLTGGTGRWRIASVG